LNHAVRKFHAHFKFLLRRNIAGGKDKGRGVGHLDVSLRAVSFGADLGFGKFAGQFNRHLRVDHREIVVGANGFPPDLIAVIVNAQAAFYQIADNVGVTGAFRIGVGEVPVNLLLAVFPIDSVRGCGFSPP